MTLHRPSRLALAAALALAACLDAGAVGSLADVSVVDRSSGSTLPTYFHRGEYWVAGTPGAKYAVQVRNRLGERVLAVTAVDGVNVLTGDTAGWGQSGYVFGGGQSYQITGWRKSNTEVAAFEFTATPNSYAERTGRPANVGVIGVALFRERTAVPPPVIHWPQPAPRPGASLRDESATGSLAREGPAPTAEPQKSARAEAAEAFDTERRAAPTAAAPMAPAPKLGTGHGERESSTVTQTEFVRLSSQPQEVIRIRYDSRENLVAMGVIRQRLPHPVPNPFPESPTARFVPDPPAMR